MKPPYIGNYLSYFYPSPWSNISQRHTILLLRLKLSHIRRRQKEGSSLLYKWRPPPPILIIIRKRFSSFCKLLYSLLLYEREVVIFFFFFHIVDIFQFYPMEVSLIIKRVLTYFLLMIIFILVIALFFIFLFLNYHSKYHFITVVTKPRFRRIE